MSMKWRWKGEVERSKTGRNAQRFWIYIFSIRNEVGSRTCTCKTERTLQISGKCVQFTQSCLRTPLSNLRTRTRQENWCNEASRLKKSSALSQHKIWRSLLAIWICYIAAKNHNLFMKWNERENKENAVRLIVHSLTHRGEMRRGRGGVKWRNGGGGGGRLLCINL